MTFQTSWVNIILFTCTRYTSKYVHYMYIELIKNSTLVQKFGQAMFNKTKPEFYCNHGRCTKKKVEKSTWYQDCAWGSCRYLNGIGKASDLPNYTDIDCYSDLRMHAFESRMDASWITYNTLCNNLFSLYPAESTNNFLHMATKQRLYTPNNCHGKFL